MYVFPRKHVHVFRKHVRLFFKGSSDSIFLCTFACYKRIIEKLFMAKKTTTTKQNHTEPSWFAALKTFFTNERTRFITGLIISILTIYVGLALISFFFTGAADQSKIENVPLGDLLTNRGSVENWTGVRGAYLSDLLMNRWFGISSFMILFFLGIGWGETHELK